jgi:hypothetical protein
VLGNGITKVNAGEITITLDGKNITLRPTMRAADLISAQLDGFETARQKLINQNRAAYIIVIRVGANMRDDQAANLGNMLFRNGMNFELLMPLLHYLAILNNGGRPLPLEQARLYNVIEGDSIDGMDSRQIEHDTRDSSVTYEGNG